MAETGWMKEWPIITGYYWQRINQTDPPSLVRIIGDTCRFTDGSSEGRHECYEFLGPLTVSDFEQLTRLREAAANAVQLIGLGQYRTAIARLDEALAQRNTGGK